MGSYSVSCHHALVNAACLNPSQTSQYSINLSRKDGKLSWSCYL